MLTALLTSTGPAGAAPTCALVPQLRDISVSQGVGSYPVLVRGKQGLARFYLSLPSCASASASIQVTGATLTVSSSATTVPAVTAYSPAASTTPPSLVPYAAAPALDAAADPKFVLPALVSTSTTARFGITLSATINYSAQASSRSAAVTGLAVFSTNPGTTTPIALTVEKKTNALRVLVVPMGDATKAYDTQFDATTRATTQNGMTALGRKLPVPDGTGDLTTTTSAGLRYTINPTLLDLSGLLETTGPLTGKFCGRGSNFDRIKGQLAQFRLSWNTANPTNPADRVLGVVKDTLSGGGDASCAEGMSAINGAEAWVRADTLHSPSMTGSLMAMELGHTMGLVPVTRADPYSPYHSAYVQADGTAPNRAYNVGLRSYLADDRTALTLSSTWNDTITLFERDDWTTLLCALGGSTTTECLASGTVGTASGVGAEPTFVLSGTTDDTADGTSVVESYFANGVARTLPDAASSYRLVQLRGSQVLRDDGVPVTFATSAHSDIGSPAPTTGLFSAAFPFDTAANKIELRKGATVLYSRERGARPTLTSSTATPGGGGGGGTPTVTGISTNSDGTPVTGHSTISGNSVSTDGKLVAFASDATDLVAADTNGSYDVFVKHTDTGAVDRVSVHDSGSQVPQGGYAPAISADGRFVSFVSADPSLDTVNGFPFPQLYVRDLIGGHTYRMFGWDSGSYTSGVGGGGALGASINSDATVVSFSTNSNLVGNDTNGPDTFVRVRASGMATAGVNELMTVKPDGTPAAAAPGGNDSYTSTSVSSDGRYVAFGSEYSDLVTSDTNGGSDIFLRDRTMAKTTLLSKTSGGGAANGASRGPQMTPDGRYVVFDSEATNLVADVDGNGASSDIFRLDLTTGATQRISVDATGTQLPGYSYGASVSASGDFVTFQNVPPSGVRDVYVWNRTSGTTTRVTNQAVDWFVSDQPLDSGTVFFSQRNGTTFGGPEDVYRWVPAPPAPSAPGTVDVSVSATDDNPVDLRLDLIYTCGGTGYPVAVGVRPTDTTSTSASWSLRADTSLACQGGTLSAVVNDGFSQAEPLAAGEVPSGSTAKSPVAAISGPVAGTTLLQFDPITLGGSGKDPESGELTGDALSWTILGPDGVTVGSGSGSVVDIAPPTGGWPAGTYTVRLQATDGAGTADLATSSLIMVGDADHDTLPVTAEGLGTCFPASADSDPTNAYLDQDGDGIPNADDFALTGQPCLAATAYSAYVTVAPDPIPLKGASGQVVTATVRVPYRDLAAVASASVRITQIAGQNVTGFGNLGWSVTRSTATAKFDRGALVRYLSSRSLLNRPVTLTISGQASSGAWSFSGIGTASTK